MRHTPLIETHRALGARMASFAGWEMPVQYASILEEASSVRTNAGLFDVSHMGRLELTGRAAADLLDTVLSVNVPKMRQGRARYNVVCTEEGGIIDDGIVYRRGDQKFLLIPNAANTGEVLDWLAGRSICGRATLGSGALSGGARPLRAIGQHHLALWYLRG